MLPLSPRKGPVVDPAGAAGGADADGGAEGDASGTVDAAARRAGANADAAAAGAGADPAAAGAGADAGPAPATHASLKSLKAEETVHRTLFFCKNSV